MSTVNRRAHERSSHPRSVSCPGAERIYPAGHYDVPVTGYWDREECAFIADILARYFAAHPITGDRSPRWRGAHRRGDGGGDLRYRSRGDMPGPPDVTGVACGALCRP